MTGWPTLRGVKITLTQSKIADKKTMIKKTINYRSVGFFRPIQLQ